jgi:hypothetical protein
MTRRSAPAFVLSFWLLLLLAFFLPLPADAQDFSATSSRQSIEKGEDLRVDLEIRTAQEPLHHLQVEVVLPLGFTLKAPPSPIPDIIEAGSSLVLPVTVQAPAQLSEVSDLSTRGVSTRDPKIFLFNLSYTRGADGSKQYRSTKFTLRYTTSMSLYLLSGTIGLLFAHIIKSLAKGRRDLEQQGASLGQILRYIFSKQLIGLVTILVIGFAVLVVLARETIPIQGWYDALALGVTLGMLGDEELLGKLR